MYTLSTRATLTFNFSTGEFLTRITNVIELPPRIADVKKNLYYVLTRGNLSAVSKNDNNILQQFYKCHPSKPRPRLLSSSLIVIQGKFALSLIVEGGILQFLDPFTLQAFCAFRLPHEYATVEYIIYQNMLWAWGRNIIYVIELDHEVKG